MTCPTGDAKNLIVPNSILKKFCLATGMNVALVAGLTAAAASMGAQNQEALPSLQNLISADDVVDLLGVRLDLTDDQKALKCAA